MNDRIESLWRQLDATYSYVAIPGSSDYIQADYNRNLLRVISDAYQDAGDRLAAECIQWIPLANLRVCKPVRSFHVNPIDIFNGPFWEHAVSPTAFFVWFNDSGFGAQTFLTDTISDGIQQTINLWKCQTETVRFNLLLDAGIYDGQDVGEWVKNIAERLRERCKGLKPSQQYWLYPHDDGSGYCRKCIDIVVAELNAGRDENEDEYKSRGGYPLDEDHQRFCETCGAILDHSWTECGIEEELTCSASDEAANQWIGPEEAWTLQDILDGGHFSPYNEEHREFIPLVAKIAKRLDVPKPKKRKVRA